MERRTSGRKLEPKDAVPSFKTIKMNDTEGSYERFHEKSQVWKNPTSNDNANIV
jgi:hypothetical protein